MLASGSAVVGVLWGLAAAGGVALLHGLVCTRTRADHVVAGMAVNLLTDATTIAVLTSVYHRKGSTPAVAQDVQGAVQSAKVAGLSPLVFGAFASVLLVAFLLHRTKAGLRIRAVGENPACAESLGVDARRVRLSAVVAAGVLAGLGGAALALDVFGFSKHMAGGRGYLALAAVVIGKWRPLPVAAATLLFALLTAIANRLQPKLEVPEQIPLMLPYVATLVVLSGIVGRARPPAALGKPTA
jgi:simple sugar transport system permease protein